MCCSLWYPACNAHAPYCHLWTARLYNIFSYYLINGTIFENVVDHKACVVIFNTTFFKHFPFWEELSEMRSKMCIFVYMQIPPYSCPILKKLDDSQHIFEDYWNMRYDENPFGGNRTVPCGRKNRHDEANSHFSAVLRMRLRTFIGFV
jgi:hypothetical protein